MTTPKSALLDSLDNVLQLQVRRGKVVGLTAKPHPTISNVHLIQISKPFFISSVPFLAKLYKCEVCNLLHRMMMN